MLFTIFEVLITNFINTSNPIFNAHYILQYRHLDVRLDLVHNIHYRVFKKSLCTWWLQYRKLQVMFIVSPASLQTFIDMPNCVLKDCIQYSTVHIPKVFCDGHIQISNCVGIVRIQWVFHRTSEKKIRQRRFRDLGGQMVLEKILSPNTSSKSVIDICAVWAVAPSCWM